MMESTRPAAVAGMFYSDHAAELRKQLGEFLEKSTHPELDHVRAIIVPHAGYVYSGQTAACAYKLLADQSHPPKRIYLLGPAHRVWFEGVALADYTAFQTPLGKYPVDRAKIQDMTEKSPLFKTLNPPHLPEHSLEVQLPFLQSIYANIPLVPMLFGEVDPLAVGQLLNAILEPGDLIIVSSDLSHFHDNQTAHKIDRHFLETLLNADQSGASKGEACGQGPILALMTIAKARNWAPHLLDYRTSGDVAGDPQRVVGYAAVAYEEQV